MHLKTDEEGNKWIIKKLERSVQCDSQNVVHFFRVPKKQQVTLTTEWKVVPEKEFEDNNK